MKAAARPTDASGLKIPVLDGIALKKLSTEPNSSKYVIDAHNRGVEEIKDLSELPKLASLDVSFNRLKTLYNVHTAKELRELKAYNNSITTLRGLKSNSNLEGLLLHENQLDELSEDLRGLGKLKRLRLNGNRLERVQFLTACRLLVHLDISRNRLTGSTAQGLESLSSLEYLNLSGNQISSIGNLAHLSKLEELNLANNAITCIDGLLPASLTVLRLNGNKITSVQSLPIHLTMLNELYLQDNMIADLDPALFTRCPELESLDLRNNRVRSVTAVLLPALKSSTKLQDLWIQGNPCCLSTTYLVDIMTALPELKTLDNLTDTHLKSQLEKLKNGTTTQEAVFATSTRPLTPSAYRPGTASGRLPGSSNGEVGTRPLTPNSRPCTADRTAPVFHQPSSRAGSVMQLLPAHEVEKAHADVAERLVKIKAMLQRMGVNSTNVSPAIPPTTKVPTKSKAQSFRGEVTTDNNNEIDDQVSRIPQQLVSPKMPTVETPLPTPTPPPQRKKKLGVDTGTDPLDSLIGNQFHSQVELTPRTSRSVDTATLLPPTPPLTVSTSTVPLTSPDKYTALEEPQQVDSGLMEREMKELLIKYANEPETESLDGENQKHNFAQKPQDDLSVMESPRIANNKMAERRPPPPQNQRSGHGYRTFRLPLRLTATNATGTVEAPQAV